MPCGHGVEKARVDKIPPQIYLQGLIDFTTESTEVSQEQPWRVAENCAAECCELSPARAT